jgi:hypothetical protein
MWIVRSCVHVDRSLDHSLAFHIHVDRSFVRELFVGSYFVCALRCTSHSFVGVIRWVILCYALRAFVGLFFRWLYVGVFALFVIIREFSCGFEVRTLGR